MWFCYIDNVLLVWKGPTKQLPAFLEQLNINTFNLSFTMTWDKESITFLDVTLYKDTNGSLTTSLFRKPPAGNSILHASSFHPQPLISSIPYSQYLSMRRNCTDDTVFKKEANILRTRLRARGYSNTCLRKACKRVCAQTREDVLYNPSSKRNKPNTISIITKFSNQHLAIKRVIAKYWHMLTMDPLIGPFVPVTLAFTYRQTSSL